MRRVILYLIIGTLILLSLVPFSECTNDKKATFKKKKVKKIQIGNNRQRLGAWKPHQKDADRTQLWVQQRSIATALGTDIIGSVQIPIHLNIFPIGLDGSGHLGISLPSGLLEHWLDVLEQPLPHVIADNWEGRFGRNNPAKDYSAAIDYTISTEVINTAPSVSSAFNRILHSVHRVVEPSAEDDGLVDAFGHMSKLMSPHVQVDGDLVSDILTDLAVTVKAPKGYNFGLLNTKRDWLIRSLKTHKIFTEAMELAIQTKQLGTRSDEYGRNTYPPFYGYRAGLSAGELAHSNHESDVLQWREEIIKGIKYESRNLDNILEKELREIDRELRDRQSGAYYKSAFPPAWEPTPMRYRMNDRSLRILNEHHEKAESGLRKEGLLSSKREVEEQNKAAQNLQQGQQGQGQPGQGQNIKKQPNYAYKKEQVGFVKSFVSARATLVGSLKPQYDSERTDSLSGSWSDEMLSLFHYDYLYPGKSPPGLVKFLKKTSPYTLYQATTNPFIQETCLSDNWVGSDRTAFLDLAAGPFKWGPVVGGVGVRTYYSFPNIDDLARLSIAEDPAIYKNGGMMYYDYVKGENRKANELERGKSKDEVIRSGVSSGGGSIVSMKGEKKYREDDVAVKRKEVDLDKPIRPEDATVEREGFVEIDKYGVENADEWGVSKKKKKNKKKKNKKRYDDEDDEEYRRRGSSSHSGRNLHSIDANTAATNTVTAADSTTGIDYTQAATDTTTSTSTTPTTSRSLHSTADDDDDYDNYFTQEELARMGKKPKPANTNTNTNTGGSTGTGTASNPRKGEYVPPKQVSDAEAANDLGWLDKLFEDPVMRESLGFLKDAPRVSPDQVQKTFDEAMKAAQTAGRSATDTRVETSHDNIPDDDDGTIAPPSTSDHPDPSGGSSGSGGEADVPDTNEFNEQQWQDLLAQFSDDNGDDNIQDLLVDEEVMRREMQQDAAEHQSTNLHQDTEVLSTKDAPQVQSLETPEEIEVNTNVQAGMYSPEQIAAEIAMLEQLIQGEACMLKALDCTEYAKELEELRVIEKKLQQQGSLKKSKKFGDKSTDNSEEDGMHPDVQLDESEAEEQDDDNTTSQNNAADIKVKAKLSLSDQNNIGEDATGIDSIDDLNAARDLWSDDEEDTAAVEQMIRLEKEMLKQKRKEKRAKERKRKQLLNAAPRNSKLSTTEWRGEINTLDHFIAHIMHSIRGYVRNVVAPPVSDMHTLKLYHRKVHYSFYVIRNHNLYDSLENQFYHKYKLALEQARVKGQQFSYQLNELHLASDPALSMAFTSAMRTAVVPTMLYDGHTSAIKRNYIDSNALYSELQARLLVRKNPLPKGTREIPIFLFSLSSELPVFIDKHYQARGLKDMVLAVQSNFDLWETPLVCNGRPSSLNMRNPLKPLIQATLHTLAGVLPHHSSFDPIHRQPTQAWQWAVGDSALSILFSNEEGTSLSKHAIDTLHRNYIIQSIKVSTSIVNKAIEQLHNIKPTEANYASLDLEYKPYSKDGKGKHVVAWEGKKVYKLLRKAHRSVRYRIHKMRKLISRLDYAVAVRYIRDLVGTAYQFHSLAEVLVKHAHNHDCLADKTTTNPALVLMSQQQHAEQPQSTDGSSNAAAAYDGQATMRHSTPKSQTISRKSARFTKSTKLHQKSATLSSISAYLWMFGGILVFMAIIYRCILATKTRTR